MDFNKEAINWDNDTRKKRAKIVADEIMKSIQIKEDYQGLEFGCGTGLVSFHLVDKFEHITLVDISAGMIEILNHKIQTSEVKNMTAIQMDIINDVELQNKKYDVIYTSMALHHIIDVRTTLVKLCELLKENGYLCIVELVEDDGSFHKLEKDFAGHNGFKQNELKITLKELGLNDIHTTTFYNDIKVMEGTEIDYALFLMVGQKTTIGIESDITK